MKKVIFHVDVNSAFFILGGVLQDPSSGGKAGLRQLVSAVGGDQEKRHGIILAKSIPAKKYHIQTGETVVSAKENVRTWFWCRPIMISITDLQKL